MADLVLMAHADHDPNLVCRPALGHGALCEVLVPEDDDEEERDG